MYRTHIDHHLQTIHNSLDQINHYLNNDFNHDPYRHRYNTPPYSGPYRGPYSNPVNSSRSYNTTRTTRYVEPEEPHEFHIRLNEPINLSDLPTPNSIASLFTNNNRENERNNVKLINDNTTITAHIHETPLNCSICREDINRDNNIKRTINHCNHEFHQKCLDKWFETKKTCPICRYELTDTPTVGVNRETINNTSVNSLD